MSSCQQPQYFRVHAVANLHAYFHSPHDTQLVTIVVVYGHCAHSSSKAQPAAVIVIFLGHNEADKLLQFVAEILRNSVIVYRALIVPITRNRKQCAEGDCRT